MITRCISPLNKKSGTALVLSGGATKAFYFHLGVLRALNLQDITSIIGSSAGAVMGTFIASGVHPDTLVSSLHQRKVYVPKFEAWTQTLSSTTLFKPKYFNILRQSVLNALTGVRFMITLPWLFNSDVVAWGLDDLIKRQSQVIGFFDSGAIEDLFKMLLPSSHFADMHTDLYVIATALDSHKRAVFNGVYDLEDDDNVFYTDVPIHRAVRASTAVPGMFEPVRIWGKYYIDGEIKRTVSSDLGLMLADKVIASHTYQPLVLQNGSSVRDMGWFNILKQSLNKVFYERIVRQCDILRKECPDKEIIWINPDPEDVDFFRAPEFTFDTKLQQKIMKSGEEAALKALELSEM